MKKIFVSAFLALSLASCGVNVDRATRNLEAQGLTNVKITGYSWFGCGQDDSFRSNFTATGVNGKPVEGSVCSGFWGKGTTIRFD